MPFGNYASRTNYVNRSNYQKSYGRAVSNAPKDSNKNKPVKKVYNQAKKPKSKTGQNKSAIMTLAKQVKNLQNLRMGELQSHTQYALLGPWENASPTSQNPILIGLNDFYDQLIKRGVNTAGVATYNNVKQLNRQSYNSDLNDEHEWNARRNEEVVSSVQYKPVYTRLQLTFDLIQTGIRYNAPIRITVLKLKPYANTNKLAINLPMHLGAYRYLAERPYATNKNYFDKKYHSILYDKWININVDNKTAEEQSNIRKNCTISWRYKDNKILKPDFATVPSGQEFFTNVPIQEQIFVLVSVNSELDDKLQSMEIGKFDVWRDDSGAN